MKNNQQGFAPVLVLLIVFGVLVVGGGAYYLGKNSTPPKDVVEDDAISEIIPPLTSQDGMGGLSTEVQLKRQEIYQAAVNQDYNKLSSLYSGTLTDSNEFFKANASKIIAVLRAPFSYRPYVPSDGVHKAYEARYIWTLSEKTGEMQITIMENGEWTYVGGWD